VSLRSLSRSLSSSFILLSMDGILCPLSSRLSLCCIRLRRVRVVLCPVSGRVSVLRCVVCAVCGLIAVPHSTVQRLFSAECTRLPSTVLLYAMRRSRVGCDAEGWQVGVWSADSHFFFLLCAIGW